jgi:cell division protein FtsB
VTWFPRLSVSTVLLVLALAAFAYLGINTARYVLHNHQLGQDENSIRREIDQLDRDNAQLTAVRDYLKTNEYIEYVARRILGLVYPGETLVVVNSDAPAATAPTPAPTTEAEPWWKELFVPTPVPASP